MAKLSPDFDRAESPSLRFALNPLAPPSALNFQCTAPESGLPGLRPARSAPEITSRLQACKKPLRRCPAGRYSLPDGHRHSWEETGACPVLSTRRQVHPFTCRAGPCRITQLKTPASTAYTAVQVFWRDSRENSQPASSGHLAKSGSELLPSSHRIPPSTTGKFGEL